MNGQDQQGQPQGPARPGATVALQPPKMMVGYNYPHSFDAFGFDVGPNPHDPSRKDPLWKSTLPKNLAALRGIGVKVVRWFIVPNGFNYGPAPRTITQQVGPGGNITRVIGWDFTPPDPVDPLFADHFQQMLTIFKQEGLQLIPSLVSFEFFGPGPGAPGPGPSAAFAAGGRQQIATDPSKRDVFLKTLLQALLDVSKSFRDQIFAWEAMNEPIHNLIRPSITGKDPLSNPDLTRQQMRDFLLAVLTKIRGELGESVPTTVGHRLWDDLSTLPTGTKPQFHYYGEPKKFHVLQWDPDPLPDNLGDVFLGEFGAMHQGQFAGVEQGNPWPELNGADVPADKVVFERLKLLAKKQYPLALVWPDLKDFQMPDPANNGKDFLKLSPGKLDQIKAFTQGLFRNGVPP